MKKTPFFSGGFNLAFFFQKGKKKKKGPPALSKRGEGEGFFGFSVSKGGGRLFPPKIFFTRLKGIKGGFTPPR